jgi:hypothetical protein
MPRTRRFAAEVGEPLAFSVRLDPPHANASYRWSVDDEAIEHGTNTTFAYEPDAPGSHRVAVAVLADGKPVAHESWVVAVRPRVTVAVPPPREPSPPVAPPPDQTPPPEPPPPVVGTPPSTAAPPRASLAEGDVRTWLAEYARAWSRKDARALQRMGQVRTNDEVERLKRYFESISDLRVEVRVLGLRVDGDKASVEFERMDTVTDPSGRQQQLRLPPMRKQIERTPDGLRFTGGDGRG